MIGRLLAFLCLAAVSLAGHASHAEGMEQSGTGFFVTSDGYFVTTHHVVGTATRVKLTLFNRAVLSAAVVATDPVHDLALLKVEGEFHALPLADSWSVRRGWSVMTVGYPQVFIQGAEPKVTRGIINSLSGINDNPGVFQVDLPIQPGNSGGPLVTEQGFVIGVIAHRLNSALLMTNLGAFTQNVNYAVKSEHLLDLIDRFPHVRSRIPAKPRRPVSSFPALTEYVEAATAIVWVASDGALVKGDTEIPMTLPAADQQ